MPTITFDQLKDGLAAIPKRRFLSLELRVFPELTDPDYDGRIVKVEWVNIQLNPWYAQSVRNQQEREGHAPTFVAKKRSWGVAIPDTPFLEHKGKIYLRMNTRRYLSERYFLDGTEVPFENVADLIAEERPPTHQGVVNYIRHRNPKLTSIIAVKYAGELYRVGH